MYATKHHLGKVGPVSFRSGLLLMLGTSLNIYPKTVHVLEFEEVVTAFSVAFATSILRGDPERAHSVDDAFDVFFEFFIAFFRSSQLNVGARQNEGGPKLIRQQALCSVS